MTDNWSYGGIQATASRYPDVGPLLRPYARSEPLQPELARSLAWWLLGVVGDRTGPADPDRVRAAVDEQRADLRERSAEADTTEDFRAGLAWADHAFDAIAAAANTAETARGVDLPPIFLIYAFRYALGRITHAVGDVASALVEHRDQLQSDWRAQIVRDIDDCGRPVHASPCR